MRSAGLRRQSKVRWRKRGLIKKLSSSMTGQLIAVQKSSSASTVGFVGRPVRTAAAMLRETASWRSRAGTGCSIWMPTITFCRKRWLDRLNLRKSTPTSTLSLARLPGSVLKMDRSYAVRPQYQSHATHGYFWHYGIFLKLVARFGEKKQSRASVGGPESCPAVKNMISIIVYWWLAPILSIVLGALRFTVTSNTQDAKQHKGHGVSTYASV